MSADKERDRVIRIIEDALYDPPEGGGLADFSDDRASGDVLANSVYDALFMDGLLD